MHAPRPGSSPLTLLLAAAVGCAVGSDDGTSAFTSANPPPTTAGMTQGGTSDGETDSVGSDSASSGGSGVSATDGSGSDGSSTAGDTTGIGTTSTSSTSSTSGGPTSSSTSSTSSTSSSSSSSSSTGGGQPADGMYSSCDLGVQECSIPPATVCLQLGNPDPNGAACTDSSQCPMGQGCFNGQCGPVNDAFCTISTCTNPAVDCDPSPGGTATPICLPSGNDSLCALDCSNGKTCPAGMTCYNVGVAFICA